MTAKDVASNWTGWSDRLYKRIDRLVENGQPRLDTVTRRRAALVLVDDLSAMVSGSRTPEVQALARLAVTRGATHEASVVAGGRVERGWAALVNAVAANWEELDEGYRPATCHGGLYALPAAMAETEAIGGSVELLLAGLVAGYEVAASVARLQTAPKPLAFHPHALLSPIGAAAAVATVRGTCVKDAVDIASTLAMAGPFGYAPQGALVENTWAGVGAWLGITAVDMAAAGLFGNGNGVLEVFSLLGHRIVPAELTGSEADMQGWAIRDGYHKAYACCQYAHSAVEAALLLRQGPLKAISSMNIESVTVHTHPLAMALNDRDPQTSLGGKFSIPHVVASVLVTGQAEPATFSEALLHDEVVARVRHRIDLQPFEPLPEAPNDRPARVNVTLSDGTTVSAETLSALGGPDRPMSEDALFHKIKHLVAVDYPSFVPVARQLVDGSIDPRTTWSDVLCQMLQR